MADVYGETLKLDSSMDLVFDGADRLMTINDVEKVKQDLEVLFRTHLGDDIFHLGMGLDFATIIEVNNEKTTKEEIRQTALQYKYISSVVDVQIRKEYDSSTQTWSEYWDLEVLLLSEEQIKITFGGVEE